MFELIAYLLIIIYLLVIIPAALGTSFGIRERYAYFMLRLFEWSASSNLSSKYENDEVTDDDCFKKKEKHHTESQSIILRKSTQNVQRKLSEIDESPLIKLNIVETLVDDCLDFITAGIEAIIEDQVTNRFKAAELASWNFLTRTSISYEYITWKLTILWIIGFFFRYLFLFPLRLFVFAIGISHLVTLTYAASFIKNKEKKKLLNEYGIKLAMRVMCRGYSTIARFHDRENRITGGGICVANHTSPTDVLLLSCDNCYAMVGQRQGGLLGFVQRALSNATEHIWFDRTEANDRKKVVERLQGHADDPEKLPIIIFPEGTCINNTSVMMFKKGSFEVSRKIYPIAIKYDSRLGDAFWCSQEQSYGEYCFRMMTSWAIMCDIWYLPPMMCNDGEDSISFARRVKHAIAEKGGLLELEWDGMLKRMKVPPKMVVAQQKRYWDRLSTRTNINNNETSGFQKISESDETNDQEEYSTAEKKIC